MSEVVKDLNTDRYAKVYIKIRDARKKLADTFEGQDSALKEELAAVEIALLDILSATGGESLRTVHGTVTRVIKERFWTENWPEVYEVIETYHAPELLEKRISQANMRQFITEHPDAYPKGMNVDRKFAIQVRKPTKSL